MVEADRATWLRRVTFDLIGLPPTVQQLGEFVADQRSDAYERVVDRLLASPHYGERWGRYWLDLARYADTNGADENHGVPVCLALSGLRGFRIQLGQALCPHGPAAVGR